MNGLVMENLTSPVSLRFGGGAGLTSQLAVTLCLRVGCAKMKVQAVVVPKLPYEIVLGEPWLHAYEGVLN
jgi:hypothetical protein